MRKLGRYPLAVMAWIAVYAGWSSVLGLVIAAVTGERLEDGDRVGPTVGLGVSTLFTVLLPLVPTLVALWFNDWLRDGAPSQADRDRARRTSSASAPGPAIPDAPDPATINGAFLPDDGELSAIDHEDPGPASSGPPGFASDLLDPAIAANSMISGDFLPVGAELWAVDHPVQVAVAPESASPEPEPEPDSESKPELEARPEPELGPGPGRETVPVVAAIALGVPELATAGADSGGFPVGRLLRGDETAPASPLAAARAIAPILALAPAQSSAPTRSNPTAPPSAVETPGPAAETALEDLAPYAEPMEYADTPAGWRSELYPEPVIDPSDPLGVGDLSHADSSTGAGIDTVSGS